MEKKQTTVGEMIASHHWRDAFEIARAASAPFEASYLGRAFRAFVNAHGAAWQADGQERISDEKLRAVWERADDAERVFMTLLKRAIRE